MMQSLLSQFSLILFLATVITGVLWALDRWRFDQQRKKRYQEVEQDFAKRNAQLQQQGVEPDWVGQKKTLELLAQRPAWLEYTAGLFPILALVFMLRSFLFEPFKIPSSSMMPTLLPGDLILVNKYTYGIRLPIINKKIISINELKRGDVVVFKYPKDPSLDYIKRVVGLPGDEIVYRNKRLIVNGKMADYERLSDYLDEQVLIYNQQWVEQVGNFEHRILLNEERPPFVVGQDNFPGAENCNYNNEGFRCKVPSGHYFMMGDNRDNSQDSRYWGFVPDQNIVGKAILIWMNLDDLGRIGIFK